MDMALEKNGEAVEKEVGMACLEKGVDVLIAVDMLTGAYENSYNKVILISSDTDLLPAILKVKKLGKEIEYVGFGHMASHAMIDNCSSSYLLRKESIEKCLKII